MLVRSVCSYRAHNVAAKSRVGVQTRGRSTAAAAAAADATEGDVSTTEWEKAKPFSEIPGPKPLPIVGNTWRFFKGSGNYGNMDLLQQQILMRKEFGNIIRVSGIIGREDQIMVFDPHIIETVFRTEGLWPVRDTVKSLHYYRTVLRKERFGGLEGTISSQGESWQSFRSKVNQPLMQPRSARLYMQPINEVADEFVEIMRGMRDENKELPENFIQELYKWALESIAMVALDTRLGCLAPGLAADSEPQRMIDAVQVILNSFYELDIRPSLYRYVSTPTWRRFVAAIDEFHDIADKYINDAWDRKKDTTGREQSILERLLNEGRQLASLMAADMLFGGVDTTSYTSAALLFYLAKNPEKQKILRDELFRALPSPKDTITAEVLNEMPYLKACLKESLRLFPITSVNMRRTIKDLVLGGYQIPKGTGVMMGQMVISRDERHFPEPNAFRPERWLRGGAEAHSAHPFVTLPFGFGVRTCVGKRFAELEVYTLVAKVLRNFRVEYHHGDELKFKATVINHITLPLKFRLLED